MIPREFFGLHINKVGEYLTWPPVGFGIWRLWDAVPRWHQLEISDDVWFDAPGVGLGRIEYALDFRDLHAPDVPVIFTFAGGYGATEHEGRVWSGVGGFPGWLAGASERRKVEEWKEYVEMIVRRFGDRIDYYEVWNEINVDQFYRGSGRLLARFAVAADSILSALDPTARLLAPSVAHDPGGDSRLEAFLASGGAEVVDIMSWHWDPQSVPERDTTAILEMRSFLAARGVGHLPLWATEGHPHAGADSAGIAARAYLVLWLYGVESWAWYDWEIWDYGPGEWILLSEPRNPSRRTAAGVAYGQLIEWLVGASVASLRIDGDVWTVQIERAADPGYRGWIVWTTGEDRGRWFSPPAGARRRSLDGSTAGLEGPTTQPIGTAPVLYETGGG